MTGWDAERVAAAADAVLERSAPGSPSRVVIDSRLAGPGDLFVALVGERVDGGEYAAAALEAGAWGVLVAPSRVSSVVRAGGGAVLCAPDPLRALGLMGRARRRELGASVICVTGSVGKTSTKELIAAMVGQSRRVFASRANFNTDIGMPLEILAAPEDTEVLVLEAAMRGFGQIADLAAIAEPDVGVITNIGPVHLEQVGSLDGVAQAKAELLVGMRDGAVAVVPVGEARLGPWLRPSLSVVTFGPGGDVDFDDLAVVELPFTARHQRLNALAALAAARAVGAPVSGRVDVSFGSLRGERLELGRGATVVNDCYNASPLSMRAALDELSTVEPAPGGRRVAVLGDMLELGADEASLHRSVGEEAAQAGVSVLVAVGPRAAGMLDAFAGEGHAVDDAGAAAALTDTLVGRGDVVLVKGSRGVGLEVVAERLVASDTGGHPDSTPAADGGSSPGHPDSSPAGHPESSPAGHPDSSPAGHPESSPAPTGGPTRG